MIRHYIIHLTIYNSSIDCEMLISKGRLLKNKSAERPAQKEQRKTTKTDKDISKSLVGVLFVEGISEKSLQDSKSIVTLHNIQQ